MRSFFDFFPISISKTMVLLSPGRFVVYRLRRGPLVISRIAAVVKSLKHCQLRGAVQVIVKHPDTGGGADPVAQPGFDLHRSFDPFREIHRIEVGQPGGRLGAEGALGAAECDSAEIAEPRNPDETAGDPV